MTNNRSIAIIGGGVAGLGPAWQLVIRGWHVEVFEKHQIGSGTSTKAAGMLAPASEATFEEEDLLSFGQQSLSQYPKWVDELETITGRDLDFRRQGTLLVAIDRDDAEALDHFREHHLRLDLPVERLVGDAAREREPGLSPNINYALFSPHDHQINPVAMIGALGEAFTAAGGVIHEETPVAGIEIGAAGVEAIVLEDESRREFSHVLVAAGAWSPQLSGIPDGILPHIRPVRGQVIAVELGDPPLIEHVVRAPDAYLVPRSNGELIIGSTMEERGFDSRLTAGGLLDILQGAWETVPAIYDASIIATWAGFRPITLANRPVIGPTAIEGLSLSVGHGRSGILLAPATAYGLAETLDTGSTPSFLLPFEP